MPTFYPIPGSQPIIASEIGLAGPPLLILPTLVYNTCTMEYLFENPIPMLMVGAVLLVFFGVWYYTSRSIAPFVGMVLVAVLTLSGLVLEQIVYTHRELIDAALYGVTDAAEANDLDAVLSHLAPTATEARALAEKVMPRLTITQANITSDIEITLDDEKDPTRATARFRGFFHARDQSGVTGAEVFPVRVELIRQDNRWLIERFESEGNDLEREAGRLMR